MVSFFYSELNLVKCMNKLILASCSIMSTCVQTRLPSVTIMKILKILMVLFLPILIALGARVGMGWA